MSATKTTPLYTAHVYSVFLAMTVTEYHEPTVQWGHGVGAEKPRQPSCGVMFAWSSPLRVGSATSSRRTVSPRSVMPNFV